MGSSEMGSKIGRMLPVDQLSVLSFSECPTSYPDSQRFCRQAPSAVLVLFSALIVITCVLFEEKR